MPEWQQPGIEYREINGFPGYDVGSDGTVWSWRIKGFVRGVRGTPMRLTLYRRPYGAKYCVVGLRAIPGGKLSVLYVHLLVLETFYGPCPDGLQCLHSDRNTANNQLSNLRWGTPKENATDKARHGTVLFGEQSPSAKYSEATIALVHEFRTQGLLQREIGKRLGMGQSYVSAILLGKKWRRSGLSELLKEAGVAP